MKGKATWKPLGLSAKKWSGGTHWRGMKPSALHSMQLREKSLRKKRRNKWPGQEGEFLVLARGSAAPAEKRRVDPPMSING